MNSIPTGRKGLALKVPPPLVTAVAASAMWLIDHAAPSLAVTLPGRALVAGLLAAAGIGLGIFGLIAFRAAGTTIHPTHPEKASAVVTTGIYARTRNPMYLGLALMLTGWAAWLGNVATLVVIPAFIAYMNRFQIIPEESAMKEKFGEPYRAYMASVRRWL